MLTFALKLSSGVTEGLMLSLALNASRSKDTFWSICIFTVPCSLNVGTVPPTQPPPPGVVSDITICCGRIVVMEMGIRYASLFALSIHLPLKPTKLGLPRKLLRSLHSLSSRGIFKSSMSKDATSPFVLSAVGVKLPVHRDELLSMILAASGPPFTWLTALSESSAIPMFRLLFTLRR